MAQPAWLPDLDYCSTWLGNPRQGSGEKLTDLRYSRARVAIHPKTLAPLLRFIRTQRIAILDCHGSRDAVYGALVKLLTGVKVIRSRHVTDPIKISGLHGLVWKHGNHGIITTAKKIQDMLETLGIPNQDKTLVTGDPVHDSV